MERAVRLYTIVLLLLVVPFINASSTSSFTLDLAEGMPSELSLDEDGFKSVFHFIVVGSGASGSVVAARYDVFVSLYYSGILTYFRLAKETNKRVLLLEGGAKGTGQRDLGGTDYVVSDFATNPITGIHNTV